MTLKENFYKTAIWLRMTLCLTLVVAYPSFAVAKENGTTLSEIVKIGLATNPEFSTLANTQSAVEQQLVQAKSQFLPSVDVQADTGFEVTNTPVIEGQELYRNQVSLTVSQLLYDGLRTNKQIEQQRALLKAAKSRTFEAAQLVSLNIVSSYINILRNRELLKSAQKNVAIHDRIYARIKDGADNGRFNLGDLAQIDARVALAHANLATVEQNLEQSKASYIQATGIEPAKHLAIPRFDAGFLPETVTEFVTYAQQNSPTLASFDAEIDAAEADYKSVRGNLLPSVNLEVTGTQGNDLGGIEGEESLGSALLVMRWNLFNGGANRALVKERLFEKAIAIDDKVNAERVLSNDIRSIWATRNANAQQIVHFNRQIIANEKVAEVYQAQFELNRRTLIDLLDTQNALFASENSKINAVFNVLFASYQLSALSGDLLQTLDITEDPASFIIPPQPIDFDKATSFFKPIAWPLKKSNTASELNKPAALKLEPSETLPRLTLIQLGSFQNEEDALNHWNKVIKKHSQTLSGLEYYIEHSLSDDQDIYHLNFGPTDRMTAEKTCAKLKKRNAGGCLIVEP